MKNFSSKYSSLTKEHLWKILESPNTNMSVVEAKAFARAVELKFPSPKNVNVSVNQNFKTSI